MKWAAILLNKKTPSEFWRIPKRFSETSMFCEDFLENFNCLSL